jgi:Domain of unknown function (DU1801)
MAPSPPSHDHVEFATVYGGKLDMIMGDAVRIDRGDSTMAELKTQPNDDDVAGFLEKVPDPQRREDAKQVCALMARVTGAPATMWGSSIIGFGQQHLVYESGRELDWFEVGLSPRKQSLTLYITEGFDGYAELLGRLGKHSTGKSCLYIKRLSDVDPEVLEEIVTRSVARPRSG